MAWFKRPFDALRRASGPAAPVSDEPVSFRPLALVRNGVREPRPDGWERVESDLALHDELAEALDGIEGYSHVIVVFFCHRVPEGERTSGRIHPRGDPALPEQGVLATRSQRRPNAIGVSVVRLLQREGALLRVRGLDAIDGTPVLDIKPYLPPYDSVPDARMPDWAPG